MLDHITFGVARFERALAFYDQALAPLGITQLYAEGPDFAGYGVAPKAFFWIGQKPTPITGTPITGTHVAFTAETRVMVDAFYQAAIAAGGTCNGPPGPRPHYHSDYYGAFVLDPDGHNIEAVCHQPAPVI